MTLNINEYYGVTIRHGEKIGPRKWRAQGTIFRRDTQVSIEVFYEEGSTMTSADSNAIAKAKNKVAFLGTPDNWKGK